MDERRKFMRLSEVWPVQYKILGQESEKERSRTTNVSVCGARFYTNAILEPGTILEVELLIPADSLPVYSRGRVVWQGKVVWCKESDDKERWPLEVGVEFTDMDDYDRQRLYGYVNQRLKKQSARS